MTHLCAHLDNGLLSGGGHLIELSADLGKPNRTPNKKTGTYTTIFNVRVDEGFLMKYILIGHWSDTTKYNLLFSVFGKTICKNDHNGVGATKRAPVSFAGAPARTRSH